MASDVDSSARSPTLSERSRNALSISASVMSPFSCISLSVVSSIEIRRPESADAIADVPTMRRAKRYDQLGGIKRLLDGIPPLVTEMRARNARMWQEAGALGTDTTPSAGRRGTR